GVSVASNAVIYGDEYSLSMFYDDVVGGGLGALGGKLGEDFAKLATGQVVGRTAEGVSKIAADAGKATRLGKQVGEATAMARAAARAVRGWGATTTAAATPASGAPAPAPEASPSATRRRASRRTGPAGLRGEHGGAPARERPPPPAGPAPPPVEPTALPEGGGP